jgi:hypothetical protein
MTISRGERKRSRKGMLIDVRYKNGIYVKGNIYDEMRGEGEGDTCSDI